MTSPKKTTKLAKGLITASPKSISRKRKICYVFQGGGALGAYQMGAYEALRGAGYSPDMIVGISIGGFNSAIIAGNKPENRIAMLNKFWDKITTTVPIPMMAELGLAKIHNWWGAQSSLINGQPGFFKPKLVRPGPLTHTTPDQLSYYDTSPLRETLLEVIDFKYLNEGHVRLCLGSVEVSSGEFVFFDNRSQEITPEHIMATGALPPGFPAVKIDDKYYIDGGVFSNTPIFKVVDEFAENPEDVESILCFMVDVFSAKGPYPHSMDGMLERVKDIQLSSHSKRPSSVFATAQNLSNAIHYLSGLLTPEQRQTPEVQEIIKLGYAHQLDVVHLIYHSPQGTELQSKDYNFSKEACRIHRDLGFNATNSLIHDKRADWDQKHAEGLTIYTLE